MEAELGDTSPLDQQQQRSICSNCDRPLPVCLCHVIPSLPIPTTTHIIIVQHPHESRHRLNTTPFLTRSLLNTTTIITRRLPHPLLPNLQSLTASSTYYLFPPSPSSPSIPLSEFKDSLKTAQSDSPLILIVFDATWKHAREMVWASEEYLSKCATRVCLDGFDEEAEGGSIYDSNMVLRKEPCGGCVSTLEAVARWLGAVEDDGPYVEGRLVGVLKEMVRLQAQFLKPIKPRPKILKRNKCKEKNDPE